MNLTIEHWTPALHRQVVLEMGLAFIAESRTGAFMGPTPSVAQLDATMRATERHGTVLVALLDGHPIGFLAILLAENVFTREVQAEDAGFWVDPAFRKTQAAPQLLAVAESWARQVGAAVLKMSAPPASGFGRWLERHGYLTVETNYAKPLTEDVNARILARVRDRRGAARRRRSDRARPGERPEPQPAEAQTEGDGDGELERPGPRDARAR